MPLSSKELSARFLRQVTLGTAENIGAALREYVVSQQGTIDEQARTIEAQDALIAQHKAHSLKQNELIAQNKISDAKWEAYELGQERLIAKYEANAAGADDLLAQYKANAATARANSDKANSIIAQYKANAATAKVNAAAAEANAVTADRLIAKHEANALESERLIAVHEANAVEADRIIATYEANAEEARGCPDHQSVIDEQTRTIDELRQTIVTLQAAQGHCHVEAQQAARKAVDRTVAGALVPATASGSGAQEQAEG